LSSRHLFLVGAVCNFSATLVVRSLNEFLFRQKPVEKRVGTYLADHAALSFMMFLQLTIDENVANVAAADGQLACDEQGTMTIKWFLFSAHQRDYLVGGSALYAIESFSKCR
jgi:hypothetical protein